MPTVRPDHHRQRMARRSTSRQSRDLEQHRPRRNRRRRASVPTPRGSANQRPDDRSRLQRRSPQQEDDRRIRWPGVCPDRASASSGGESNGSPSQQSANPEQQTGCSGATGVRSPPPQRHVERPNLNCTHFLAKHFRSFCIPDRHTKATKAQPGPTSHRGPPPAKERRHAHSLRQNGLCCNNGRSGNRCRSGNRRQRRQPRHDRVCAKHHAHDRPDRRVVRLRGDGCRQVQRVVGDIYPLRCGDKDDESSNALGGKRQRSV